MKNMTTGEGDMALTNVPEIARRMARLRSHGITRELADLIHEADGPWYYEQIELGFNYCLTDLQAALGLSQFDRLDEFVARRHAISNRYDVALRQLPLIKPWQHQHGYSGIHLYVIRVQHDQVSKTHREVFEGLCAGGIGVNLHYIPVYRHAHYAQMGFELSKFPKPEYTEVVSLPIYPTLTEALQDQVVVTLREVLLA